MHEHSVQVPNRSIREPFIAWSRSPHGESTGEERNGDGWGRCDPSLRGRKRLAERPGSEPWSSRRSATGHRVRHVPCACFTPSSRLRAPFRPRVSELSFFLEDVTAAIEAAVLADPVRKLGSIAFRARARVDRRESQVGAPLPLARLARLAFRVRHGSRGSTGSPREASSVGCPTEDFGPLRAR